MGHLDFILQLWIGSYGIIAVIIWFKGGRYQGKLKAYVQKNYPQFYNDYLFAPLISVNTEDVQRRWVAFKYLLWGKMPDEKSKHYQDKINFFMKLFFLWIVIAVITLISILMYLRK